MRLIRDDGVGHPFDESEKWVAGRDGAAVTRANRNLESWWARWGRSLALIESPKRAQGRSRSRTARQHGSWRERGLVAHTRAEPSKGQDPANAVGKRKSQREVATEFLKKKRPGRSLLRSGPFRVYGSSSRSQYDARRGLSQV